MRHPPNWSCAVLASVLETQRKPRLTVRFGQVQLSCCVEAGSAKASVHAEIQRLSCFFRAEVLTPRQLMRTHGHCEGTGRYVPQGRTPALCASKARGIPTLVSRRFCLWTAFKSGHEP